MLRETIDKYWTHGGSLFRLIFINVAIFLGLSILNIFAYLFNYNNFFADVINWLGIKGSLSHLLFHPWSLITHMFLHIDLWHILWNLLMLYMAGKIFTEYLGEKRLLGVYILGALSGAILYITSFNVFPKLDNFFLTNLPAFGASAAVLAVLVAIAVYVPNFTVRLLLLGNVKLSYIAIFFVLMDVINFGRDSNVGGHIGHIGGALFGYLYILQYKRGKDYALYFGNFVTRIFTPQPKIKVVYNKRESDEEYHTRKNNEQKEVDAILDKISKSGYDSLSKKEKETLFKRSGRSN